MDPKTIAKTAAVVLLVGAVLACALELAQRDRTLKPSTTAADDNMDPLANELSRCKALGAEAANDAACKAAWAQEPRAVPCAVGTAPGPLNRVISRDTKCAASGTNDSIGTECHQRSQSDVSTPGTDPEGR